MIEYGSEVGAACELRTMFDDGSGRSGDTTRVVSRGQGLISKEYLEI